MLLGGADIGEQVQGFIREQPWLDRIVNALVDTWNAVPISTRWTLGMVVVVCFALGRFLLPGIALIVAAARGHMEKSGVITPKKEKADD